jgi:hypothetical protein
VPQVFVPDAFRSHASTTPERRPTRRHCQAPAPSPPLRLRARLPLLRTVSNIPRSIPLLLVHFGALTSSPERPRRPHPAPAVHGVRAPPLNPLSCAHAPPLLNAPARGQNDGREHCPGTTPASLRRAPPLSGDTAAASRLFASTAFRSRVDDQDRIPLRVMWPVHRGPVSRAHGAVHRARARPRPLGRRSTVRLWRFLLRAPEQFYFRMPVLPPYENLAVRSWILQASPCLP